MTSFVEGQPVHWLHTSRGGYGYIRRVPATVVHQTDSRVMITVKTVSGNIVYRSVRPENLQPAQPASQLTEPQS
jgi:hypothetical protein